MRIMFFGDSNTWGYDPETSLRFTNRYTQLIQSELNDDVIIEEGLNGRTLCQNDPYDPDRNGCLDIKRCIKSHLPLDILVIMLGTNDAKRMYNTNVYSLEKGMNALLDKVFDPSLYKKGFDTPKVLIVCPPRMNPSYIKDPKTFANFGKEGFNMIEEAKDHLAEVAKSYGVDFVDTKIMAGDYDGLHLQSKEHKELAEQLIIKIRGMKS